MYLNDLKAAGFVSRDYTWLLKSGKSSKLSHFRLSDNYLPFYTKYIAPQKGKILEGDFENAPLPPFTNWDSIMGLQFENLVLSNRKAIKKALRLNPSDIVTNNPFFQRKTQRQQGSQIDYLIQTESGSMFVCEIKFSRTEISTKVIDEVKEKIERINLPKRVVCHPVLIHANGVSQGVGESGHFSKMIDFSELLEEMGSIGRKP